MTDFEDVIKEAASKRPILENATVVISEPEKTIEVSTVVSANTVTIANTVSTTNVVKTMIKDLPIVKGKTKLVKRSKYMNDMLTVQKT